MNIRRIVSDVDKAVSRPTLIEITRAIEAIPGVHDLNLTVTEIDIETVGTNITIEGENLDYDELVKAIEATVTVVHSIDQIVAGKQIVEMVSRKRCRNGGDCLVGRILLPMVLGLADGILTTLTFAAGQLTEASHKMPMNRAFRIAAGALVSGVFAFYVAHYGKLRGAIVHAKRQLNLRLASTRLGRIVFSEALWSAII